MRPASHTHATYQARPSWRSRIASSAIALAIVALVILALIRMGAISLDPPGDGRSLATFDVTPPGPKAAPAQRRAARTKTTPRKTQPARAAPPPPPLPPPPIELPGVLNLSRADFASSNIGRFPKADPAAGNATEVAGADTGGGSDGGGGPNGERLYNAEWVRRPTRAEMVTYLPKRAESGWGMVACRTVERNRVEDCREIGETPGSGIARGLRQASWQFLVRPPRVNGTPMVGAWVRIKFDVVIGLER